MVLYFIFTFCAIKEENYMAYFNVLCKAGHLGKGSYMPIWFPVQAEDGREAARIARYISRVKHHHPDAILDCVEIDYEQYVNQQMINNNDPYLNCHSKQEQNQIMPLIIDRILPDDHQRRRDRQKYRKNKVNLYVQTKRYDCRQDYYERINDAEL